MYLLEDMRAEIGGSLSAGRSQSQWCYVLKGIPGNSQNKS